jgi:hypothetical protein
MVSVSGSQRHSVDDLLPRFRRRPGRRVGQQDLRSMMTGD